MSTTTEIGSIAIPVGWYEQDGKTKKRYRNIGKLMKTTREGEGEGFWLALNAEALSPSLLIQARPLMDKGSDRVVLSIFTDDEKQPQKPAADPDADL